MKHVSLLGLVLFLLYCLLYLGFMLINTFHPSLMETRPFLGLNLSITYGFGLIFAAFAFALIYGWFGNDDTTSAESSSETLQKESRS